MSIEVFRVRFPLGDGEVNERLWEEIDEQHFPAELRRRLRRNGFRVGLVGGSIPVTLSKLLEIENKPPPTGDVNHVNLAEMDTTPRVERRYMQLRAGRRGEILTSAIYDELPVLVCRSGQVSGETYAKAQAMLAVKAFPQNDGRVRVELVPELCHDEPRQRWVAGQGSFRLETGRPSQVFDDLAVSALLSPGGMLIISSMPNHPGSLGHHFLSETDDYPVQKLLVVRLAQTQHDDLFAPPEALRLAE